MDMQNTDISKNYFSLCRTMLLFIQDGLKADKLARMFVSMERSFLRAGNERNATVPLV